MKIAIYVAFLFAGVLMTAQSHQDTIQAQKLEDVVVTGQFEPQSVKKSVFNVRVISEQDIKKLAANNLADVLNQYLNIVVRPSSNDGRSTVSLFGLDGQYFKILIDNVPLVSDSGIGNSIDLTQVNLDDVAQIEIIEGSMGVTHGANAVSGILNIITKKSSLHDWEVSATVQEETVRDEYSWFKRGRHIQAFRAGHNINQKLFASVGVNRNDLTGYLGDHKGETHMSNDAKRGYTALPKEQVVSNATLNYQGKNTRFFYKFDYLNELVNFYNRSVGIIANPPFEETRWANDNRFYTNRFYHHLNMDGSHSGIKYNVSLSHQLQSREREDFQFHLNDNSEHNNIRYTDQSSELIYSTGTLSNFIKSELVDLQLGYELVSNIGFSRVMGANNSIKRMRERLENYDLFFSGEYKANSRFSIRPGVRYSFHSKFDNQYAASLGFRYLFDNGPEARISFGKSYRTPSFEELYYEFIDSSHYYTGNEGLIPEGSTSFEASLKKNYKVGNTEIASTLSACYIDVNDRISFILTDNGPPAKYQFANINEYNTVNLALANQFRHRDLNLSAGVSIVGVSQVIDNGLAVSDDKFLYTMQANMAVSYSAAKWNTVFSLSYKYNGRQQNFTESFDAGGNPTYKLTETGAFSWADASVRKHFFDKKFDVTVGVRNLLDITTVRQLSPNPGTAHPSSGNLFLGQGRSYFLKLTYHLNF